MLATSDWSLTDEQQKDLERQAAEEAMLNKLTWKRLAKMAVMAARKKAGITGKKEWGMAIAKAKLRINFQSLIRAALNDKVWIKNIHTPLLSPSLPFIASNLDSILYRYAM